MLYFIATIARVTITKIFFRFPSCQNRFKNIALVCGVILKHYGLYSLTKLWPYFSVYDQKSEILYQLEIHIGNELKCTWPSTEEFRAQDSHSREL